MEERRATLFALTDGSHVISINQCFLKGPLVNKIKEMLIKSQSLKAGKVAFASKGCAMKNLLDFAFILTGARDGNSISVS